MVQTPGKRRLIRNAVQWPDWRVVTGVACLLVTSLLLGSLWPEVALELVAKEGRIEWASHLVLLVAIVAWVRRAGASSRRGASLGVAAFLVLVLVEELSWGSELGIDMLASRVRSIAGRADFHNAWGGASYLLFGLPLIWIFGPALLGLDGRWATGVSVTSAWCAGAVAAFQFFAQILFPTWEAHIQEFSEWVLYVVLWLSAAPAKP